MIALRLFLHESTCNTIDQKGDRKANKLRSTRHDSHRRFGIVVLITCVTSIIFFQSLWELLLLDVNGPYNKKTARVCFLSGNIARAVFLAGKPTRPQVEWVSQAKKTTRQRDISTQKIHECRYLFITCHYQEYFEAFLARIVANLILKFKTKSSALTS
jgi:hypothetical protein